MCTCTYRQDTFYNLSSAIGYPSFHIWLLFRPTDGAESRATFSFLGISVAPSSGWKSIFKLGWKMSLSPSMWAQALWSSVKLFNLPTAKAHHKGFKKFKPWLFQCRITLIPSYLDTSSLKWPFEWKCFSFVQYLWKMLGIGIFTTSVAKFTSEWPIYRGPKPYLFSTQTNKKAMTMNLFISRLLLFCRKCIKL